MATQHVDAIIQAVAEPDPGIQAELQRRRDAESAQRVVQRRVAWLTLLGAALGCVIAHYSSVRLAHGMLYGGLAAAAIGWLASWRMAS